MTALKISLLVSLSLVSFAVSAQHPTGYAQYMLNGLLLNPACAGSQEALNLTAIYRHQWAGIGGAPRGVSFTGHTPFTNRKLNGGIVIESDQAGLDTRTAGSAVFAYRIRFDRSWLAFGIQGGTEVLSLDRELMRLRHGDDPVFLQTQRTAGMIAGAGFYYHRKNLYAGFSAPAMFPHDHFGPRLFQAHGGGVFNISSDLRLKPSLLARYLTNSPLLVSAALTTYYQETIGLGLGYTHRTSWFAYLDLRLTPQLNFGYAFEQSPGMLARYSAGSHEIMLRYLFRYRVAATNPRYF